MSKRVTIQDIADALGLSRNTVSKAINNTGVLSDSTREKVLQKTVEMGYKQFTYMNPEQLKFASQEATPQKPQGEIAIITCAPLDNFHFSSTMLDKFQRETAQLGYSITIHRVSDEEQANHQLPNSFHPENVCGIICIETFNYDYAKMICNLDIPVLFVDHPVLMGRPLPADRLLMDNQDEIFAFVREMKKCGKTSIGFIGEQLHCQSFFERCMATRNALYINSLPINEEFFIIDAPKDTLTDYKTYLFNYIQNLKELPDVFVCANDFIAFDLMQILRQLNIQVPEDICLCGFDDSPAAKLITPPLTSIHIHNEILGVCAVDLLLSRIKDPTLNYRTVYTETNIVYRESANIAPNK